MNNALLKPMNINEKIILLKLKCTTFEIHKPQRKCMSCNQIFALVNGSVCMNLCVLYLNPRGYYLVEHGQIWQLCHQDLSKPVAEIERTDSHTLERLSFLIAKLLDKVTKSIFAFKNIDG